MQQLLSIVIPESEKKKKSLYQELIVEEVGEWSIPDFLKRILKQRFKDNYRILVF